MRRAVLFVLALLMATNLAVAKGGGYGGHHYVAPHTTKTGSFVQGHYNTNPNKSKLDNWSTKGNVNPYTGKAGTKPVQ